MICASIEKMAANHTTIACEIPFKKLCDLTPGQFYKILRFSIKKRNGVREIEIEMTEYDKVAQDFCLTLPAPLLEKFSVEEFIELCRDIDQRLALMQFVGGPTETIRFYKSEGEITGNDEP